MWRHSCSAIWLARQDLCAQIQNSIGSLPDPPQLLSTSYAEFKTQNHKEGDKGLAGQTIPQPYPQSSMGTSSFNFQFHAHTVLRVASLKKVLMLLSNRQRQNTIVPYFIEVYWHHAIPY